MTELQERLSAALAGRYWLERELGQGGMATVYLARDLKHERPVALKILRPELGAILGAERFLREIRLTANLQHPHILPLLDSGEAAGLFFYVMPYVEGESLRALLQREGPLPLDEALRLAREVAEALDCAHGQGIIHRDIKPENILLSRGHAVVADFGIALAVTQAGGGRLTETGLSLGTPAYMSPEQAMAEPRLDARSDQYSLACVLYEMLAGEPPYTGPTAQAVIAKRLSEPVPSLSTLRQVPAEVGAAVTRALARASADRFPSVGAFASALRAVGSYQPSESPPKPRHRRLAAATAVIVVVGLGLAVLTRARTEEGALTSIAVLHVRDLTEGDSSAFAAGLTEDIGSAAAAVPGLLVVSSRSAAVAERESDDPRTIGRRLGVGALLETTVRTSGDELRVVAQLVRARDGAVLWSNRYDRTRSDVIAIQEDLADAVAGALRLRLTAKAAGTGQKQDRLVDPRAYDLYARAVQIRQRHRSLADLTLARALLDSAISADSAFGRAYGELAFTLRQQIDFGAPYGEISLALTRAVERGLAVNPDEPRTLVVAADIAASHHLPDSARRLMRRALAVAPGDAYVRGVSAGLLTSQLDLDQGLYEAKIALQLAPLDASTIGPMAWNLVRLGEYGEAISAVERAISLNPQDPFFYLVRGKARACLGQWREAFGDLRRGERAGFFGLALLGSAHALHGDTAEAAGILGRLTNLASREQALPVSVAWIHALLGHADSAFAWLARADAAGNPYTGIADPPFDGLAGDPRWLEWARRDLGDSAAMAARATLLERPRCRPESRPPS